MIYCVDSDSQVRILAYSRNSALLNILPSISVVRTLHVVCVRYQARSRVRILLVFIDTEFNHKRKDSEVD